MAVSKQTFSTVRDILEQLDTRISEARERRTGNPAQQPSSVSAQRQFGSHTSSDQIHPSDSTRQS